MLHVLTHLIFISTLWDDTYYPILAAEDIGGPERLSVLPEGSVASMGRFQNSNLGNLIPNHYVDLTRKTA